MVVKIRGPFLGTLNNRCRIIIGTPKRDHNFDNYSYGALGFGVTGLWDLAVNGLRAVGYGGSQRLQYPLIKEYT